MPSISFDDALRNGEKAKLIPICRLESLREALACFKRDEALNRFQEWILGGLYSFEPPGGFPALSILLVAIPHPFYAHVELAQSGKRYRCLSPVASDFETTEANIRAALPEGYLLAAAENLPLKRLAVQSGLAEYGRNNICYIGGMGSSFSLSAFFSDIPCEDGDWNEVRVASICSDCGYCLARCPTGAIREDRFLIDNMRCLSYLNERAEPFPPWLDEAVHHCLYDCLSFELYPPPLAEKARYLGLQKWPDGIAKNVRALIALGDREGRAPLPLSRDL
jgi:epoxyqueuosine reductase